VAFAGGRDGKPGDQLALVIADRSRDAAQTDLRFFIVKGHFVAANPVEFLFQRIEARQ
jgi:hypothetical protein